MKYLIRYRAPIAPAAVLTRDDIVDGSLRMSSGQIFNSPSSVIVQYMPSTGTAEPWVPADATQQLAGVDTGEIPDIESTIELHGIRRATEALRKANHRLLRLQYQGRYSWQAFDAGIKFQRGDVVQLPNMRGLVNQWVRILNVTLATYGLYDVEAEHYDPEMYSDELAPVGPDGTAPVGLIVLYDGAGSVPGGWEAYTAANGRLLVGAGNDYDVCTEYGETSIASFTAETNEGGAHTGGSGWTFYEQWGGLGPLTNGIDPSGALVGGHKHDVTVPEVTPNIYRRQFRLIKKTGESSITVPRNSIMLGREGIFAAGIQRVMDYNDRLIGAGASPESAGVVSQSVTSIVASANDAHAHAVNVPNVGYAAGHTTTTSSIGGGGAHTHALSLTMTQDLKRVAVAAYSSNAAFAIKPGFIGMWDGDIGDIPADWYLCDGENGTINIVDMFAQITSNEAGAALGDGTMLFSGTSSSFPHSHSQNLPEPVGNRDYWATVHSDLVWHSHTASIRKQWTPKCFGIYFIQYVPATPEEE